MKVVVVDFVEALFQGKHRGEAVTPQHFRVQVGAARLTRHAWIHGGKYGCRHAHMQVHTKTHEHVRAVMYVHTHTHTHRGKKKGREGEK